jgi:hypothetical protein
LLNTGRSERLRELHRGLAIGSLAADLETGVVEQRCDQHTEQRIVVYHQNATGAHAAAAVVAVLRTFA